jgi:nascent polypeptide-associated complex subunit alpha
VREEEGKPGEERKGESKEESDVEVVARQAGVSRGEAENALEESGGDIAEAIMSLEAKKKR